MIMQCLKSFGKYILVDIQTGPALKYLRWKFYLFIYAM